MTLSKSILVIGLFSLMSPSISAQVQPPPGWRFPNKWDVKGDWVTYKSPIHVEADFNGDGLRDNAWILLRTHDSGWGLFIFLGTKQGPPQIIKLVDASNGGPPQRYAISLAPPSRKLWKTACGKGYFNCKPGEPEAIQIMKPSIEFCYIESSCSIYMWDAKKNAFSEYKMSD
jgi:hypothetical protein